MKEREREREREREQERERDLQNYLVNNIIYICPLLT